MRSISLQRRIYLNCHRIQSYIRPVKTRLGGFAVAELNPSQYAATVHVTDEDVGQVMKEIGFTWNPVSALKVLKDTGAVEIGSWAYWPQGLRTSPYQYHVHAFSNQDLPRYVDLYVHHEFNWFRHPLRHLRVEHLEFPAEWLLERLDEAQVPFFRREDIFGPISELE